jgi:hypothetical protein
MTVHCSICRLESPSSDSVTGLIKWLEGQGWVCARDGWVCKKCKEEEHDHKG